MGSAKNAPACRILITSSTGAAEANSRRRQASPRATSGHDTDRRNRRTERLAGGANLKQAIEIEDVEVRVAALEHAAELSKQVR
jgi:hypothetical protein